MVTRRERAPDDVAHETVNDWQTYSGRALTPAWHGSQDLCFALFAVVSHIIYLATWD
jgi:hypothetical protein